MLLSALIRLETRLRSVLQDNRGIDSMVGSIIMVAGALVLGGVIFAFLKGGGTNWLNQVFTNLTTNYQP